MRALIVACLIRPIVRLLARVEVYGRDFIPSQGPAIIAANHNSHFDTLVILCQFQPDALSRVRPVAAADHFLKSPLSAWLYRQVFGIVAVERKHITKGSTILAECVDALEGKDILLVYPEGTRGDREDMGALKGGIARLCQAFPDAPVVPVYVRGTRRIFPPGAILPKPGKCSLTFGSPMTTTGNRRLFMGRLNQALRQLQSDSAGETAA
jgi:1-acyl-sn-glycerol-3-phosphate acyltransferase